MFILFNLSIVSLLDIAVAQAGHKMFRTVSGENVGNYSIMVKTLSKLSGLACAGCLCHSAALSNSPVCKFPIIFLSHFSHAILDYLIFFLIKMGFHKLIS